jgi:hypothetical protein
MTSRTAPTISRNGLRYTFAVSKHVHWSGIEFWHQLLLIDRSIGRRNGKKTTIGVKLPQSKIQNIAPQHRAQTVESSEMFKVFSVGLPLESVPPPRTHLLLQP